MAINDVRVSGGTRIGYWRLTEHHKPFHPIGYYYGPDLGSQIPGKRLIWPLIDGELIMKVGVLFRPDLGKYQKLETVLIVLNYVEEMWDYDDFQREGLLSQSDN